ncbi:MAG TPA: NUDIX domain-containing protein [Spirochaetota bacterium]|nr:NUDIX domain-containing protein [Spirochaetota bacterium]
MFFKNRNIRVRVAGIITRDNKVLLIAHKKGREEYWLVPGGGIDYGESARDALIREMKEELSADVLVNDLVFSCDSIDPSGARHVLNLFFLCDSDDSVLKIGDDPRLSRFDYFSAEELSGLTIHPPCSEQLIRLLKGIPQPVYQGSVWEE